jgi:hypothetical protein
MNDLTKQRYISTSIWSDDWFDSLAITEKLIYFNLLTNDHTNVAGVYPFALKYIRADLDISRDEVAKAMEKFERDGKAFFYHEYMIIPKWLKHQKIGVRGNLFMGVLKILRALPDDIKRFIADRAHYDFDIRKYIEIPDTLLEKERKNEIPYAENRTENEYPIGEMYEKPDTLSENDTENGIAYQGNDTEDGYPIDTADEYPIGKTSEIPDTLLEKERKNEIPYAENRTFSTHDLDLDSDLDLDNGGGKLYISTRKKNSPPVENSPPPLSQPNLYALIKDKAKIVGYYIDDSIAQKIAQSNPYPVWFTGNHSIIEFAVEKINANPKYSPKPVEERKLIFISALTKWENIRDEYPDWLNKQVEMDKRKALEQLQNTPPEKCPHCGVDLRGKQRCNQCGGLIQFDKDKKAWIYHEALKPPSFSEFLKQRDKKPHDTTDPPNTVKQEEKEIDF